MKTRYIFFLVTLIASCTVSKSHEGALSLFDGKSLAGWHIDVPAMDDNKKAINPFIVRDDKLVSLGTPGGHLISDISFFNYRINLEYRFAGAPGNCGALVHVSKPRRLYEMFPQSIEVQMMHENAGDFWLIGEDLEVPNMVERRGPKERWGVDGNKNRRIPNLDGDKEVPLGEWNNMQIECFRNEIKVWLNGELVNYGYNTTALSGSFALQSEGSEVEFRKVLMTPIKKLSSRPSH
ncbi:MAG: hypothetical protein ACI9IP_001239 [Arcticibacterium sp.]|jgi:hypothetical protein